MSPCWKKSPHKRFMIELHLHTHTHTHTHTSPASCQVSRHCSTNKMETWHSWSILITEIITHWSLGMLLILRAVVCITVISDLNNLKGLFSPLKFKILSHVWMSLQGLINVYWCIEQQLKWLSCVWLCFSPGLDLDKSSERKKKKKWIYTREQVNIDQRQINKSEFSPPAGSK